MKSPVATHQLHGCRASRVEFILARKSHNIAKYAAKKRTNVQVRRMRREAR
jgi:hypothetical protein